MKKLKNPRATLQFPIKAGTPKWRHLIEAEKHLHKAGVSFDTGYAIQEHIRDWELDWSLKGAKLTHVEEMKSDKQEKKTPEKKVGMKQKMQGFANKHKLIINPYAETKIEWMEKHGRRCYCEPDGSRICPCKFCLKDIKEFNGCCLCRVFVTEDKMKRIEKYQKQKSLNMSIKK